MPDNNASHQTIRSPSAYSPLLAVLVAVMGLSGYVGSYLYLAATNWTEVWPDPFTNPPTTSGLTWHFYPSPTMAGRIFAPIHWLDEQIRPSYWSEKLDVSEIDRGGTSRVPFLAGESSTDDDEPVLCRP